MIASPRNVPTSIVVGMCLSLCSILFGFLLGGLFGSFEDALKKQLSDSGNAALESVYKGDTAARDAVVSKSWVYLQRAHLHGGAIGTAALAAILAMVAVCRLGLVAKLSALSLGAGALLYSTFWLLAGLTAPGIGSTGAAKEALSFLAIPGAGCCILGLCGTIFSVVFGRGVGAAERGARES